MESGKKTSMRERSVPYNPEVNVALSFEKMEVNLLFKLNMS